ncbi:glutamyl-tRNA reductase [Vulcanococcus limneticus]|uniref:glutamyl-tRNA reductase n=1 Tax=Vulcanococcus limneticus TaxID=2170428 RepID=UPI000B99041C|nr:glutamyl-tRNA reductase [Vulcanococcus limneticus]MCP9791594.1 glutamyl-tRNA reductase [Vulcanococcus limneticus MW73D5]MCP9893450.1 glutamyl-tRNA reductase [Vulcanococcus limneticus Candia 3F8]MCP9896992.1 glutamyl-tRNA reductase [Vulcanococcus limneticus Candia 3B3]
MHIAVVGLSHHTAPVEIRERLSIAEQTMEDSLQRLRADEQVLEASILSTCNRLEIYTLLRHPEQGVTAVGTFLSEVSGLELGDLTPHLFTYHHEEAVGHLMRVAAGLDSLVLGEGQILSQVKKMYRLGQEHRSIGPILNRLLNQAVSTGKRVRTETNLGTGAVSISSAAVELAQLKVGQARGVDDLVPLDQEQIAVVGAGRMARLLLQHLQAKGAKGVVLLNRTVERAEQMAADFPGLPVQCRPLSDLNHCLSTCSLVFTSTAADDPIIDAERLGRLNRRSSLMLIDIGVPRNIAADVAGLGGVESYDVDDLQEVVARNQEARREIAAEAEGLLQEEGRQFLEWWDGLEAVPIVNRLRLQLEDIREQELQKALSRMGPDLSARERKVVEALSKGIINKILHTPVTNLRAPQPRQQRHVAMKVIQDLFELYDSSAEA